MSLYQHAAFPLDVELTPIRNSVSNSSPFNSFAGQEASPKRVPLLTLRDGNRSRIMGLGNRDMKSIPRTRLGLTTRARTSLVRYGDLWPRCEYLGFTITYKLTCAVV